MLTPARVLADLVRTHAPYVLVRGEFPENPTRTHRGEAWRAVFTLIGLPDPCPAEEFEARIEAWVREQERVGIRLSPTPGQLPAIEWENEPRYPYQEPD